MSGSDLDLITTTLTVVVFTAVMEAIGLGLSILATVDICYKHGTTLVHLCKAFRNADSELQERILRVEASWLKTSSQLEFLCRIADKLSEQHQIVQQGMLRVLLSKLEDAITKLESVTKTKKNKDSSQDEGLQVNRVKYLFLKESIDNAIENLKIWQDEFDPSWFMIMMLAAPQVDTELMNIGKSSTALTVLNSAQSVRAALGHDGPPHSPIFLPSDRLDAFQRLDIEFSTAKLVERPGSGNNLILDRISYPSRTDPADFRKPVEVLARKLSHSDPRTFGLLKCKGVVAHKDPDKGPLPEFTLVLRIPQGWSDPQSLRNCLIKRNTDHSLSDRFQLAKDLAKAVGYVHMFGFVHKNVRPETILVFKSPKSTIGSISLVGFKDIRPEIGGSLRIGDAEWVKNLYRHPRRQGLNPEDTYVMQHDIYSLGVCLLELGIWDSLVRYKEGTTIVDPSPALRLPGDSPTGPITVSHLVRLARTLLPRRMGNNYAEVVETCLTCLDKDNADFGNEDEFVDQDGIQVGVRYIEKVTKLYLVSEHEPLVLTSSRHTSTLALPQPHKAIPHISSDGPADDAEALRDIFNPSSSICGCQTPAKPPDCLPDSRASFDHGFHIGSRSHSSHDQQPSRIERLGEHIRQKLSETKLSRATLKQDVRDDSVDLHSIASVPAQQGNQPLGLSHSSPGLTELLTSRNASRGGYDSDAHTIKTPLLHSNTGTLTLKPDSGCARDVDMLFQKDCRDLNPGKSHDWLPASPCVPETVQMGDEKGISPPTVTTPPKTSFTAAVESSLNESPSDALRRLSIGITSGTIKMPGTPELRELHKPASCEQDHTAGLAPHSASSEQGDKIETVHKALKRLSDCVQSCVEQSSVDGQKEEKQSSLVLELDPALVNYIRQFSSSDELRRAERANWVPTEEAGLETQEKRSVPSTAEPRLSLLQSPRQPVKQTDEDSVHLFNMRISQRLASLSQIPVVSPSLSSEDSWLGGSEVGNRPRSASLPQNKVPSETNGPIRFSRRGKELTASAERMSEINIGPLLDRRYDGTKGTSQECVQDRRDEDFSEIDQSAFPAHTSQAWMCQNSVQPSIVPRSQEDDDILLGAPARGTRSSEQIQEIEDTITNVWGKAFKNMRDETYRSSSGNFLRAPQFDREGRRRSTRSNTNTSSLQPRSSLSNSLVEQGRARSADPVSKPASRPTTALADSDQNIATPHPHEAKSCNLKSKELKGESTNSGLDVTRTLMSTGPSTIECPPRSASTPLDSLFRIWSRFPTHDREERNGVATLQDSVDGKDFQPVGLAKPTSRAGSPSLTSHGSPFSLKILPRSVHKQLNKAKSNSMNFRTKAALFPTTVRRAKPNRTGILDMWHKGQSNSVSEPHDDTMSSDHQRKFKLGDEAEHECGWDEVSLRESEIEKWCSQLDDRVHSPPAIERHCSPLLKPAPQSKGLATEQIALGQTGPVDASKEQSELASTVGNLPGTHDDVNPKADTNHQEFDGALAAETDKQEAERFARPVSSVNGHEGGQ
ncbi:hypothetical protein DV738_g640, partial [Chaetothyriales sp. CBS 135597]